jgi:hypothetical protein
MTGGADRMVWAFGEISDTGVHAVVCSSGHTSEFRLAFEPPHELLLDVGALALLDGYYREAVSSFAAGLEQSYEFFVEASLSAAGVNDEEVRKLLSANRFDQRRAGMVSLCYLQETGRSFPYLQSKRAEFRNRVIHNASWPTRPEAVEFAEYVCDAVRGLDTVLGKKKSALLGRREEAADMEAGKILFAGGVPPSSVFRPNFFAIVQSTGSFEEGLTKFSKEGWWKWPKGLHLVR